MKSSASGRRLLTTLISIALASAANSLVLAQTGGSLDLRRNVIAGGGGSSTGSGNMRVDGTAGQPAAGRQMSGGTLTQVGGFWPTILGLASALPVVQFSAASYTVGEGSPRVDITLTRSGDTTSMASVGFVTNDAAGLQNCNVFNGVASPRCDFIHTIGTMTFAAGETSKSFSVAIINDSYAEGAENFTVSLNNPSGAALGTQSTTTVMIVDNETTTGPNPIDNTDFFVRQQYIDFLGREPDGLSGAWVDTINNCTGDTTQCDRIHVSQ